MPNSSSRPPRADPSIGEAGPARVEETLRGPGLGIDYGAAVIRVRSGLARFAADLHRVYGAFPLEPPLPFSDIHLEMRAGGGLRRLVRPQVVLEADRQQPFEPFPLDSALPMFEWGVNWFVAQRLQQHLLLHAGTVAIGERAIILAAPPGSGKSTLTAALMLAGFRLLSDEFGVVETSTARMLPMLKPIALKNTAIEVIRKRHPDAVIGPLFPNTRKGDVAHVAPDRDSVSARRRPAVPAAIVFPRYEAGSRLTVREVRPAEAFARLAFNSFNYAILGPRSFDVLGAIVADAPACELVYSDLDGAIAHLHALVAEEAVADVA